MVSKESLTKFLSVTGRIIDIASPSDANAQAILEWIMPDISVDELKRSLTYYYKYLETNDEKYVPYFDPVPALFAKYSAIQKHMRIAKKIGLAWLPYIQKYVANPSYVIEMIGRKKPEIKRMLSTPLGDSYAKYFSRRLYEFFSLWFREFPRWHNGCGGLILYTKISEKTNAWGFTCRRYHAIIPIEKLDELTYKTRKFKGGRFHGSSENPQ